jgi:DNA-binding CsgD family transcriptional regulator
MLLGRKTERLAIDRLLADARDGRSGTLALLGEPGIGKTALLEYAVARAGSLSVADGVGAMRVLRARGIESEAAVPFAGLSELLRPALGAIGRIPAPQAVALEGALALAPATAQDRFATGAAALSLVSAYADDAPLLLVVDDAHLLDESSAEALLFAARRLVADPIAVLIAVREGEPSLLDGADLRVLQVAGLDRSDAAELLARADVTGDAIERLFLATGGNPLALLELAPDATRIAAAPPSAPVPISTSIAAAFARRSEKLPLEARRVLALAAASDVGDLAVIARAASSLGLDLRDLASAEEDGLVNLDHGVVEFRHPLARSALYAAAPASERRAAHAALAGALPDRDIDRRAWHLAAASVGPDDAAAEALEQAGARAQERTAYAVAAAAFERAASLSTTDVSRANRLFAAADAAWLSGHGERTTTLLDAAQMYVDDGVLTARIDHLRGRVMIHNGPVMHGYPLIVSAATRIADSDPDLAVEMLTEAVRAAFYAGETAAMLAAAERGVAVAANNGSARASALAAMSEGVALVADGQGEAGAAAVRRSIDIVERSQDLRDDARLLAWVSLGPLWLRESQAGRTLIDRGFDRARRLAAVGLLPTMLQNVARDQATTDQWAAAEVSLDEAIRLARETGQRAELTAALAGLAWLEARQGREERCRAHAAEARDLCAELGMGTYHVWTIQALGDLELALGRPARALEHYGAQIDALRERHIADVDLSPEPELVEVHLRLSDAGAAAEAAMAFVARAEEKGQPWALARAARCRGLLATGDEIERWFDEALRLHARTPDVFEAARTHLAYGACLRRTRQRVRARDELRSALEMFESLGAPSWADQASGELAATGETARRRDASTRDDLTPQELQIARLLADGKTTREAAAAVFLSPKTIEYHLRNVYRKLGISSREELARVSRIR